MLFSIYTLQCVFVGASVVMALVFSLIADKNGEDGLTWWAIGLCLNACAYLIYGLKSFIFILHTVPLAQAIISLSYVSFLLAICKLLKHPVPQWLAALPPLLTFLGSLAFIHTPSLINVFVCSIMFLQVTHICSILIQSPFGFFSRGRYLALLGGGIVLIIDGLRISVAMYTNLGSGTLLTIQELVKTSFILAFFSLLCTGFGFLWMVRERRPAKL